MERLFESQEPTPDDSLPEDAPLATRMRPRTLDDLVGQKKLLASGSALRRAIEEGRPHSMILHGPPGSGKTTLARLVAQSSDAAFEEESAVAAGRAEVRAVIERARDRLRSGRRTVFFLDEIHRFNKAQQDALLPAVEDGVITLIGATTENPYFSVNSALISRSHLLRAGGARARGRAGPARPGDRGRATAGLSAGSTRRRSTSSPSAPAATRARRSTRSSWPARPPGRMTAPCDPGPRGGRDAAPRDPL